MKLSNSAICKNSTILNSIYFYSYQDFVMMELVRVETFLKYKRTVEGRMFVGDHFYLYNDLIDTKTRFVSFMGEESRFDLAITNDRSLLWKKISS